MHDCDTAKAWIDILCCPNCYGTLELIVNELLNEQSLQCGNCREEFPGVVGSFDLTITEGERELERHHYQQKYLSCLASLSTDFDPERRSRRWADPHWPECCIILNRIGDLNGKVVLCLGNGASTKEFHFLTLGARVIFSDLSMSGVLAAKSRYNLGALACRAAFHAMDACRIPVRDHVVYGYAFVHHLPDLDAFLHEVHRTLKAGGLCVFFDNAYSPSWQVAKRTFLWPVMRLSHLLHRKSPADVRATYAGSYKECFLQDLAARHGLSKGFFDCVMFFQYLFTRGVGSIFGWKLPSACYRIPGTIGRSMNRLLTDRLNFLRRNRIGMVWGFRS